MTSNQDSFGAGQDAVAAFGWPILLVCLSVFVWAGFQVYQVYQDRVALQASFEAQETPLVQAEKVRTILGGITQGLSNLSKAGNQNAAAIIDQLKKAGVVIGDQQKASDEAPQAPAPGEMMMRQAAPAGK